MADVSVKMGVSGVSQLIQSMQQAGASVKTIDAALKQNVKQLKATGDAETYLQQKTAYEEMMDNLSDNISRQEKAITEMEVPQEGPEMEMTVFDLKKHLILDRNFSDLFIRQITVYADRHIDVLWNFCEE